MGIYLGNVELPEINLGQNLNFSTGGTEAIYAGDDIIWNRPPLVRDVGAGASGGTGSIATTMVTHEAGDLLLLFVESEIGSGLLTPSGWTLVANATNTNVTTGNKIFLYSLLAANNATPAPSLSGHSNHVHSRIVSIKDGSSSISTEVAADTGVETLAAGTITVPSMTLPARFGKFFVFLGRGDDATQANFDYSGGNLNSFSELADLGTTFNNGGGLGVAGGDNLSNLGSGSITVTSTRQTAISRMSIFVPRLF